MKTNLFLILVSISCLCSCKETVTEIDYKSLEFKETANRPLTVLGDSLDNVPRYMEVIDSFLVMQHGSLKNDQLFHVYNRFTGSYIRSFGEVGRAYGELLNRSMYFSTDYKTKSLIVGNITQNKLVDFSLDSLGYGKIGIHQKNLKKPLSYVDFFKITPDYFLSAYGRNSRFELVDKEMNVIDSCDYYALISPGADINTMHKYYFHNSKNKVKPDGTKFVNITSNGLIIEIFGVNHGQINHITTKYYYKPLYNKQGASLRGENIYGLITADVTDNYIYMLFNGTKDRSAKVEKISVFDWEGRPVKQYDLGVNLVRLRIKEELGIGYVVYKDDDFQYRLGSFEL